MKTIKQKMKKDDIAKIIQKVAKNHANKHFSIYDHDDIMQQTAIICWQKLSDFDFKKVKEKDPSKALENWLNKVASNRLKNFFRDNYQNKKKVFKNDFQESDKLKRESLLSPLYLGGTTIDLGKLDVENIYVKEILNNISDMLEEEYLDVLEALLNGERINSYYKKRLQNNIETILWNTKSQNEE